MTAKRPASSRPSRAHEYTKAQDREREQTAKTQAHGQLWARIRREYPEAVRKVVDEVSAGGLTYTDLRDLEMAEHERLGSYIRRIVERKGKPAKTAKTGPEAGARSLAALCSTQLQCRKNLRHLVALCGGNKGLGEQPVHNPAGVPSYDELNRRADEIAERGDEVFS